MRAASVCPQYGVPGQSPGARESLMMPSAHTREAPPDGWPETPPTLRTTHGGTLAIAHLLALLVLAAAAAWCAWEVRSLRNTVDARYRAQEAVRDDDG